MALLGHDPMFEVAQVIEHAAARLAVLRPVASHSHLVESAFRQTKEASRFLDTQWWTEQIA
jgi:hypothetical protein